MDNQNCTISEKKIIEDTSTDSLYYVVLASMQIWLSARVYCSLIQWYDYTHSLTANVVFAIAEEVRIIFKPLMVLFCLGAFQE